MTAQVLIDNHHRRLVRAGDTVFLEDEPGDTAFFVESGQLEVSRGSGDELFVLAHLGPGEIIGEMSLIDASPRSATVRALSDAELSVIDRATLNQRLQLADPLVQLLVHSMLNRLRAASTQLGAKERRASLVEVVGEGREADQVSSVHQSARASADIEARLRLALERDELELHYQPIVRFDGGETVGFEALLRWPDGEGGFHSPFEFVPVAEQSLMILDIDQWVMRRACEDALRLRCGGSKPYVSINVSSRQFASSAFLDTLLQTLADTGAEPKHLQIEVTEGAMIESPQRAMEVLRELRNMGFKVALDDFGTGYSSLSYLQKLDANVLKIDRSFVVQMRHGRAGATIIKAIAALGNALGMTVIVEGVETNSEALRLRGIGCELAQGFGYSKPLPIEAAVAWLNKGPAQITT
ncbi:EAL domain-containing protein [bacterium]|nr:EAL domain-containing protein [bacterium]